MTATAELETFERERLATLVSGNTQLAFEFHHPDFQLVTPSGETLSRADYMERIRSGALRYVRWEPEAMSVRLSNSAAVARYRSTIDVELNGVRLPTTNFWHTDYYERIDGRWR